MERRRVDFLFSTSFCRYFALIESAPELSCHFTFQSANPAIEWQSSHRPWAQLCGLCSMFVLAAILPGRQRPNPRARGAFLFVRPTGRKNKKTAAHAAVFLHYSERGGRTHDRADMSRLLCQLSYLATNPVHVLYRGGASLVKRSPAPSTRRYRLSRPRWSA